MLNPGDIVLVKFPYAESKGYKYRPALVVSGNAFHKAYGMCWVLMITSALNTKLADDIELLPSKSSGLNMQCVIKPGKIATIQIDKTNKIGKTSSLICKKAIKQVESYLGKPK